MGQSQPQGHLDLDLLSSHLRLVVLHTPHHNRDHHLLVFHRPEHNQILLPHKRLRRDLPLLLNIRRNVMGSLP